ncbi:MAG: hypothetical protein NT145_05690 [Elusimicrobia bacterium]|nr:hypothetical protein [Elusimicrobiota bacterium]
MIFIYDLLFIIFFVPVSAYFIIKNIKNLKKEVFYKLEERLGIWNFRKIIFEKDVVWFHCASIGEVRAVEPLISKLKENITILTTMTVSGREYAENRKIADFVFFVPVDFSFFIKKVLRKIRLKTLFLVETELWPALILEVKRHKAKIAIINGRMSIKTYYFYKLVKFFFKRIFENIDIICARSSEDAQRFKNLGCDEKKIFVTGNIKYDRDLAAPSFSRNEVNISNSDIILVAGSTKQGEEKIVVNVWKLLRNRFNNLKLVLAPRYISRINEIGKYLKYKGISYSLYSSKSFHDFDCLLVDTFGDLMKFYSIADLVFVGGSLANKGGQNPIEPASFSKAILFGPHMENFSNEANLLIEKGGGFVVRDETELFKKAEELLSDKGLLIESGKKANECVIEQKGALKNIMGVILPLLK